MKIMFLFVPLALLLLLVPAVFAQCQSGDYYNSSTGQCETNPETSMNCPRGRLVGTKCVYDPSAQPTTENYNPFSDSSYPYGQEYSSEKWYESIAKNLFDYKSPVFWGLICIVIGIILLIFGKLLALLLIILGLMLIGLSSSTAQSFMKEFFQNIMNYLRTIKF